MPPLAQSWGAVPRRMRASDRISDVNTIAFLKAESTTACELEFTNHTAVAARWRVTANALAQLDKVSTPLTRRIEG